MSTEFRSYTTIEVARRLGVSLQTVQRWVDAGHLRAWKTPGGHRRIDADSADAFISAQQAVATASRQGAKAADAAARRVLIVDDNPLDMELLQRLVSRILPGCEMETASDGFEALVRVGTRAPDTIVTDINMPHMDGFEMIRSLATVCVVKPQTIVAVSSLSTTELAPRARMLPQVVFLSKPVDEAALARALGAEPSISRL